MAKLFGGAYVKSASVQNAVNGFKKPGIWPYDPNVFGDEDYAPSSMTDRPLNDISSTTTTCSLNNASSTMTDGSLNEASMILDHVLNENECITTNGGSIIESSKIQETTSEIIEKESESSIITISNTTLLQKSNTPEGEVVGSTDLLAPVVKHSILTPLQIRPIPTMSSPKTNRKNNRQKSQVLTSTPVKTEQAIKYLKTKNKHLKISELAGPSKTKIKKTSINTKNKKAKPICFCLVCNEKYIEPPTEDWIRCDQCKKWAHENCTSYTGVGSYFCDDCED